MSLAAIAARVLSTALRALAMNSAWASVLGSSFRRAAGEGSAASPLDPEHELAHYYKFAEIWHGRRLIPTPEPPGYAYAGDPIPFDPTGVWPTGAHA